MKKVITLFAAIVITIAAAKESYAQFDAGADIVSAYIWRGSILADGPSVQPWMSYAVGEEDVTFEVGAWGSYAFFDGISEADLYATLGLGPVAITITDYYFPSTGAPYFDYEASHTLEASVGAEFGGLSLLAAYNFAGYRDLNIDGEDDPGIYIEGSYGFDTGVSVFAGVGDEFYQAESFGLVNVGVGYEKEILGGLPAFGQVVLNPEAESFGIVFGVSL